MMLDQNLIGLFSPKYGELKIIETSMPHDNCYLPRAWIESDYI